eukprot:1154239-Pelagomonas_calceolata.AAC.1
MGSTAQEAHAGAVPLPGMAGLSAAALPAAAPAPAAAAAAAAAAPIPPLFALPATALAAPLRPSSVAAAQAASSRSEGSSGVRPTRTPGGLPLRPAGGYKPQVNSQLACIAAVSMHESWERSLENLEHIYSPLSLQQHRLCYAGWGDVRCTCAIVLKQKGS